MIDTLQFLWKYRKVATSRRFLPAVSVGGFVVLGTSVGWEALALALNVGPLALLLGTVAGGASIAIGVVFVLPHERRWLRQARQMINDCRFEEAGHTLASPPPLLGFPARIKRIHALIDLKIAAGDLPSAYSDLLSAEQQPLLQDERHALLLTRANLMFQAGNYAAFCKALGEIDESRLSDESLRFRHALLKSYEYELAGQYSLAKAILEEAEEGASGSGSRMSAVNNLARLEDVQGNDTNALGYFERAWQMLRAEPVPALFPIVGHNLLLKYARCGDVQKAIGLLDEYRAMIAPENVQQYLQFLNDQTHLARQIGNSPALSDSYESCRRELAPKLNGRQQLQLRVSELWMRLNDGLPFDEQLAETIALLDADKDMPTRDRFRAMSGLLKVLRNCDPRRLEGDLRNVVQRVVNEMLAMKGEVDVQIRDLPPALPILRDEWYGYKLELLKLKIGLSFPVLFHADFDDLFDLLKQRQSMWADKGNPEGQMNALIGICDEYVSYGDQLGPRFVAEGSYLAVARQALADAVQLIERQWPHPSMYPHSLAIAFFSWRLAGDRETAKRWLSRFEQRKLSLMHTATALRGWYEGVKNWLSADTQDVRGTA